MKLKPHNQGQWTPARYKSFIMSALRRAQWPCKFGAILVARRGKGINPATGRQCFLHECEECHQLFPAKEVRADHIKPIVPVTGFDTWDKTIERLFCEIEGFQVLCVPCHKVKTDIENKQRKANKDLQSAKS
jgi:5-methylcytosine-specific restriction endonuclease McrA